jgi:hypothetical protein
MSKITTPATIILHYRTIIFKDHNNTQEGTPLEEVNWGINRKTNLKRSHRAPVESYWCDVDLMKLARLQLANLPWHNLTIVLVGKETNTVRTNE